MKNIVQRENISRSQGKKIKKKKKETLISMYYDTDAVRILELQKENKITPTLNQPWTKGKCVTNQNIL